jgi:hypothetical protein
VAACEKALARKPVGAVGLALARLHEVEVVANNLATDNHPAELDTEYGEPLREHHGATTEALEAYRRAKAATAPGDDVGAWARYGLAAQQWMKGDAAAARDELAALQPTAPAAWRAELAFRLGVAHAAVGDERAAGAAFGQALAAAGPGDVVTRRELRQARLVAEYRAGEHRSALALAIELLDDVAPSKRGVSFARESFGLERATVVRLAADCVERLGRGQADLARATPATAGAILARLAVRELYRGDRDAAAATVAAALARLPADAAVRPLLADLGALARGPLDEAGRKRLRAEVAAEIRSRASLLAALGALGGRAELPLEEQELEAALAPDKTPVAERRVRSLVRLCLEPAAGWLARRPAARGESTLELNARADRGRPVVEVTLPNERELAPTADCLVRVGERILPPAPLHASVDLQHAGITAAQLKWREELKTLGKDRLGTGALERAATRGLGGLGGVGGAGGLGTRGSAAGGGGAIGIGGLGRGGGTVVKGTGQGATGRDRDRLLRKLKGQREAADEDRGRPVPPEPPAPLPKQRR